MARVKKIWIRNVMGIDELEIEPGDVTIIEGGNGTGKTSVLEAIKAAEAGGHDATLLRNGAEQGETVLLFEDDVEVRKRIWAHKSDLVGKHPTMGTISAAQTYLRGLTDHLSLNPVEFLTSSNRVERLLEAMPLSLERSTLQEAVEGTGLDVPDLDGHHALQAIEVVKKRVYDERTGENRIVKENRTTSEQLEASLPADFENPTVLENRLRDLEGAHRDASQELQRQLSELDTERERELGRIREATALRVRELEEEIRKLERESAAAIETTTADFASKKEDLLLDRRPQVNQIGTQVTELREQLKAADRYENTRVMLEKARATAAAHEAQSEAMSAALGRLDLLKTHLLKQLPIPGIEIRDGEIYEGDVPFPRLNMARRIKLAVRLSALRAGALKLVVVDGLECLEKEPFNLFVQELAESGLQGIVTRVTSGPLTVRTVDAEELAHA